MKLGLLLVCALSPLLFCFNLRVGATETSDVPSVANLKSDPAVLLLDTKEKRMYKTLLREAAKEPANFNGHHRLTFWGCGSNCISWAVIDLDSGHVWMAPEPVDSCWPRNRVDEEEKKVPDWFEFSVNSSSIISYACDDTSGMFVFNLKRQYEWRNGAPHLLQTDHVEF